MILLTGFSGFVGHAISRALSDAGNSVVCAVRHLSSDMSSKGLLQHEVGSINDRTLWSEALVGVDTVIHCAALAHATSDKSSSELGRYREVNVGGTIRLAQEAVASGVKRFVFLSSIKVNGEATLPGQAFTELDRPAPQDAYGISKLEAESALLSLSSRTGLEVVIIRSPLVYGPCVKGNFASMLLSVQRGIPLPFGAVKNQRSLVALDNLVSLVLLCADWRHSPQAANEVFLVADGEDVSTCKLLQKVAKAMGRPNRLLSVPPGLLAVGASLLGKRYVVDRLLGNLQVDASKARALLGWRPVVTMDEQLLKMFERKG